MRGAQSPNRKEVAKTQSHHNVVNVTREVVPRAVGTLEDVTKVRRGQGRGQVKL